MELDIKVILSQMRHHHEIQTGTLIAQATALFKLEAELSEKEKIVQEQKHVQPDYSYIYKIKN